MKLPRIVTEIPGPKSRRLFEEEQQVISPGVQRFSQVAKIAVAEAQGSVVTDVDGNQFIDFIAGIAVAALGHSHPNWVKAVQEQAAKVSVGSFTSEARLNLLKMIASITPPGLNKTQLYSGGAEAVEAALRLAKSHTKKFEIVGFWGGFHGKTGGVLPLIGDPFKQGWGPLSGGTHSVPYADCYRCPINMQYPSCGMACMDLARKQIKSTTAGSIAAIIVEPMQGTAGNVIPPKEFLPIVREMADENGALLICDEMITGFGRTGKMFGLEHTGVAPDIITIGKGLGSGFPVTGLISRDEIVKAQPYSKPSAASSSYGGNPLAAAAAHASTGQVLSPRRRSCAASVESRTAAPRATSRSASATSRASARRRTSARCSSRCAPASACRSPCPRSTRTRRPASRTPWACAQASACRSPRRGP